MLDKLPRAFLDRLRGRTLVAAFDHDGRQIQARYRPGAVLETSAALGLDGTKRPDGLETLRWLGDVLVELDGRPFTLYASDVDNAILEPAVEAVVEHFKAWVVRGGWARLPQQPSHGPGRRKRRRR